MPGVQALSCESGWVQTGSLSVKERLGGWRNQGALRESATVCVHVRCAHTSPPVNSLQLLSPGGNNPCLCEHLQARLPPLPPTVLAAFVHLGTQTASVGVLQAVGVVCAEAFSLSSLAARSPSHVFKNTDHTLHGPSLRANPGVSQNHFIYTVSASVWKYDTFDHFLWLWIRTTRMKNFPYLQFTDKLFAFGKCKTDWRVLLDYSRDCFFYCCINQDGDIFKH